MRILYRISNNSYNKAKLKNATKEHCFRNFLDNFLTTKDKLYIIADNVNDELRDYLKRLTPNNGHLFEVNTGSNGASFRLQLSLISQIPPDEVVFLHEDDYLYRPHPNDSADTKYNNTVLLEGLDKADYATLYDHPDKYLPPELGGNPLVSNKGIEHSGVFLSKHSHWKYTNSTTLTFAAKSSTLLADRAIWLKYVSGEHPDDFHAFLELGKHGRLLASAIPGLSSNTEPPWLSPLYDWDKL